ncbi:MAG: hypothetical protein JW863_00760 [Chitinispirillaceae bacterium]|nr:hypothetical protein [Chitinispirillaceae bacterium]
MNTISVSLLILAVLFLMCNESPTGPGESNDIPLLLTTTGSSSVAVITRIPDKKAYVKGDNVVIIVSPSPGYSFIGWSGDTTATGDTLTIVMNKNMTIYGNFVDSATGNRIFSITTGAENGTIVLAPSGGVYDSGTTVTITAQPDYGFSFSNWSGDLSGTTGTIDVIANKNFAVIASFSEDPNAVFTTLHISPAPVHGKILLDPPGVTSGDGYKFQPGVSVSITTEPDEGYRFTAWGGDFSDTDSSETSVLVTMDADHTVSATFNKMPVGMTWTGRTSGTTNTLLAVIWTGSSSGAGGTGQLIATGNSGVILTSPDGTTWTNRNSGISNSLNAIACSSSGTGTGPLVIVGNGGSVLTSTDGITWTVRSSGVTDNLYAIAWTGKQFVAVGGRVTSDEVGTQGVSRVISSPDGVTWTDHGCGGDGIWYSLTWTGSALYAAGFDNHQSMITGVGLRDYSSPVIYSSSDAASWTQVFKPGIYDLDFRAIARSDSRFVVVGRPTGTASTPYAPFYTSSEGTTWEDQSWASESGYYGATWTGDEFVIVGDKGVVLLITDPEMMITKKYVESGTTRSLYGVTWTGSKLVAVGNSGTIMTSP